MVVCSQDHVLTYSNCPHSISCSIVLLHCLPITFNYSLVDGSWNSVPFSWRSLNKVKLVSCGSVIQIKPAVGFLVLLT